MDQIAGLGTVILDQFGPTYKAYGDLLSQPAAVSFIHATKRKTFSYGPLERQKLDLYTPSSTAPKPATAGPSPIVAFIYGGAFVSGDRIIAAIPGELVYRGLGSFFADKCGFETIVMDYRLLEHGAKFPSGGEDVDGVMSWVEKHFREKREMFWLGNSAGGAHLMTWLFERRFEERRNTFVHGTNGITLKGVGGGGMEQMLTTYYGGMNEAQESEVTRLMEKATKGASEGEMSGWPRLLVAVSELDPEHMHVMGKEFVKLWQERGGQGTMIEFKGHNHLSPPLSLGSGVETEEAWGYETAKWMTGA